MKQGTGFIRIIFAVLLVALLAYGVFAVVATMQDSITTVTAIAYEAGDGFQATGFVVRDEQVISSSGGIHVFSLAEGERVRAGAKIATVYTDGDAQQVQTEIDRLEAEIDQLQYAMDASSALTDEASLDAQIREDLLQCATLVARRNLEAVETVSGQLKSEVLRRYLQAGDDSAMLQQLSELRSQLSALKTQLLGTTRQVQAPDSGWFSAVADGYEPLLSSETLHTMTPAEFTTLTQQQVQAPSGAIGKLITRGDWYFACLADEALLEGYGTGDRLTVNFAYDFYEELSMQIARISPAEEGRCLLVLSCDEYLQQVTTLRQQTADIVYQSYAGLRVPKRAIYYSDAHQSAGVYVLEAREAVWKSIEILSETDDSYIVKLDKSSIDNLWPGDEIILTSQELFDGKVVY